MLPVPSSRTRAALRVAPRRGKFWQLLPAALFGLPLLAGVQFLHAEPVALGLLVVPATFLAFPRPLEVRSRRRSRDRMKVSISQCCGDSPR